MRNVKNLLMAFVLAYTSVSIVFAQDSFSVGINVGGGVHHEDYYQSTRQYSNQNLSIEQYSTQFYGAPPIIYYVAPGARFGRIYHEPIRQHNYAPNVIFYSNDGHSQHRYDHHTRQQHSNPRWSAGNQGYIDGNNGRNYRGYTNIESHQGHGHNHHNHHNHQHQRQHQYQHNGSR